MTGSRVNKDYQEEKKQTKLLNLSCSDECTIKITGFEDKRNKGKNVAEEEKLCLNNFSVFKKLDKSTSAVFTSSRRIVYEAEKS